MPSAPLQIEQLPGPEPGSTLLKLHGPVIVNNLPALRQKLQTSDEPVLVVDLSDVPYMDSGGLGVLVNGYVTRQNRQWRIAFVAPSASVLALMRMTRVDTVLPIFASVEQAKAATA
jgi:anti-sigma B factor antagonist